MKPCGLAVLLLALGLALGGLHEALGQAPLACVRPDAWCPPPYIAETVDCGDDFRYLDVICTNAAGTRRGAILSSNGCQYLDVVTRWPLAPSWACPNRFTTALPTCAIPDWWCSGGDQYYDVADCDGDDTVDLVCYNLDSGAALGAVLSSRGCSVAADQTGWPAPPAALCPSKLIPPPAVCEVPSSWCAPPLLLEKADCDGDGTLDLVCRDPAGGNSNSSSRGVVLSARNCSVEPEATGWPSAPPTLCPAAFLSPPLCRSYPGYRALPHTDHPGSDIENYNSQTNTLRNNGRPIVDNTQPPVWPGTFVEECDADPACRGFNWLGWVKTAVTPEVTTRDACLWVKIDQVPACPRPFQWCTQYQGIFAVFPTPTYSTADCDGDGVLDLICTDIAGQRGVILSSRNCSADDSQTGWPSAPAELCPAKFPLTEPPSPEPPVMPQPPSPRPPVPGPPSPKPPARRPPSLRPPSNKPPSIKPPSNKPPCRKRPPRKPSPPRPPTPKP